jgi:hypothetical protein
LFAIPFSSPVISLIFSLSLSSAKKSSYPDQNYIPSLASLETETLHLDRLSLSLSPLYQNLNYSVLSLAGATSTPSLQHLIFDGHMNMYVLTETPTRLLPRRPRPVCLSPSLTRLSPYSLINCIHQQKPFQVKSQPQESRPRSDLMTLKSISSSELLYIGIDNLGWWSNMLLCCPVLELSPNSKLKLLLWRRHISKLNLCTRSFLLIFWPQIITFSII